MENYSNPRAGIYPGELQKLDAAAIDILKSDAFNRELKKCLGSHGLSLSDAEAVMSDPLGNPSTKMAIINSRILAARKSGLFAAKTERPDGPANASVVIGL